MNRKEILSTLLDASEYGLHLVTMVGAVALLLYTVYDVITNQSWNALLFVVTAIALLSINVMMRTKTSPPGAG